MGSRRARRRPSVRTRSSETATTGRTVPRRRDSLGNFPLQSCAPVRTMRRPVNTCLVPEATSRRAWRPGRRMGRIRCGDRTERDHPREVRKPETAAEAEHRGDPGARGRRRSAGTAPRRSELRRSGDYSGPSAVPAACRRSPCVSYPGGTVPTWTRSSMASTPRNATRSPAAPLPLAILAGAGSGKTRVLTRRIAWQSREGLIDPRPRARGHVHPQGGGRAPRPPRPPRRARVGHRRHLPRHRARPAAAPRRGRAAAPCPACSSARCGSSCRLLPARGREGALLAAELASEIEWAKARPRQARRVRAGGRRRRARHSPRPPAEVADVYRDYEREKRKRGPRRLRRPHHRLRRRARARRRVRGRAALAVPPPVRRRVPGRQRRAVPAAARLARRPQRPVRGRRSRPGDLRLRRRRRVVPRAVPPLVPARTASPTSESSGSAATTARRRRSLRQPARCSAPRAGAAPVHAAQPDGPAARRSPSTTPRTTKPAASPGALRDAESATCRGRAWRCSTGSTRSRRCSRRRSAAPACRSGSAAAGGSSTAPR